MNDLPSWPNLFRKVQLSDLSSFSMSQLSNFGHALGNHSNCTHVADWQSDMLIDRVTDWSKVILLTGSMRLQINYTQLTKWPNTFCINKRSLHSRKVRSILGHNVHILFPPSNQYLSSHRRGSPLDQPPSLNLSWGTNPVAYLLCL